MAKRKSSPILPPAEKLNTYNFKLVAGMEQINYDIACFAHRSPMSVGAPPRYEQFKRLAEYHLPGHFEWHEWTERAIKPLLPDTDEKKICTLRGFAGCSSSGKTFNITSFACLWWLMWPQESSVTLVSTTKNMLRRRGWAEVQRVFYNLRGHERAGNMIDSRTLWQFNKGDDKHAIVAQAVEEGSITKVADNIKGTHTKRQMIIIDEATSIPPAIYAACANLYSYPDEFILAVIGNPWNRLDQFGLFCEPDKGWQSVNVDSGEWEAKPFEFCGGIKPYVMTFDAEKSPNITEGKIVSKHLPKKEEVESARKNSGGGNTPYYWQNKRGFWPPEGLIQTIFTDSLFTKFNAIRGKLEFKNDQYEIIGALDPAFGGGDDPCLRFAKLGETVEGGYGIQIMKPIMLHVDANTPEKPVTYQLLSQLKQHCERVEVEKGVFRECRPECLGVDDSGEGGLCDVIYKEWSHQVMRIVFQGAASEDPVSLEDERPAKEVYFNKRAQMYFYSRSCVSSGQMKGIDQETASELCGIKFDSSRKRTVVQDKHEYRAEHQDRSPDRSDSLVMLPEVARRRGFRLKALGETKKVIEEVAIDVNKAQEVYNEENLWQEEEFEPIESFQ